MRKSFVLVLVLLIFASLVLPIMHMQVNALKDKVSIAETTLFGDIGEAKGITIGYNLQYQNHMFWNTDIVIGDELAVNTEFEFFQGGRNYVRRNDYSRSSCIYAEIASLNFGMSTSGGDLLENIDEYERKHFMYLPVLDVANRTQPYETRTETVYIKDYYDYYPMNIEIDLSADYEVRDYDTVCSRLENIFRIPVVPQHTMTISVSKGASDVYEIETNSDYGLYAIYGGVVTDNGVYFTLGASQDWNEEPIRTKNSGLEYGVYYMPFHIEKETVKGVQKPVDYIVPEVEKLSTVMEPGEEQTIIDMQWNYTKSSIVLVVQENDSYKLITMEPETGKKIQELTILPKGEVGLSKMLIYEDHTLIYLWDGQFALLNEKTPGIFNIEFTASFAAETEIWDYMYYEPITAYDGKRFVVANGSDRYVRDGCCVRIAVYEDGKLLYAGRFEHSLGNDINSRGLCRTAVNDPITLTLSK